MKKVRNKTRTKQYPQGKPTVDFSVKWLEYKIKGLEDKYAEYAKNFVMYVDTGVGLTNIYVLETLRTLTFLYTDIAAHRDALRSLKGEI
jgi:predicted oxidoreductase (fatty acid repression mutant protein)